MGRNHGDFGHEPKTLNQPKTLQSNYRKPKPLIYDPTQTEPEHPQARIELV